MAPTTNITPKIKDAMNAKAVNPMVSKTSFVPDCSESDMISNLIKIIYVLGSKTDFGKIVLSVNHDWTIKYYKKVSHIKKRKKITEITSILLKSRSLVLAIEFVVIYPLLKHFKEIEDHSEDLDKHIAHIHTQREELAKKFQ